MDKDKRDAGFDGIDLGTPTIDPLNKGLDLGDDGRDPFAAAGTPPTGDKPSDRPTTARRITLDDLEYDVDDKGDTTGFTAGTPPPRRGFGPDIDPPRRRPSRWASMKSNCANYWRELGFIIGILLIIAVSCYNSYGDAKARAAVGMKDGQTVISVATDVAKAEIAKAVGSVNGTAPSTGLIATIKSVARGLVTSAVAGIAASVDAVKTTVSGLVTRVTDLEAKVASLMSGSSANTRRNPDLVDLKKRVDAIEIRDGDLARHVMALEARPTSGGSSTFVLTDEDKELLKPVGPEHSLVLAELRGRPLATYVKELYYLLKKAASNPASDYEEIMRKEFVDDVEAAGYSGDTLTTAATKNVLRYFDSLHRKAHEEFASIEAAAAKKYGAPAVAARLELETKRHSALIERLEFERYRRSIDS